MILATTVNLYSQIDARMLRYPDVSGTHITFTYAGDIWIVEKTGGIAYRLSSPKGEEQYARFSPDGSRIAFTGNYDGNEDVYVINSMGGYPERLTYHPGGDRVVGWHPDEEKVLFASSRESGTQRYSQFYAMAAGQPLPEKLREALEQAHLYPLYSHQAWGINLSRSGKNVMVVTPTASGKTLCYNVPVLESLLEEQGSRVLPFPLYTGSPSNCDAKSYALSCLKIKQKLGVHRVQELCICLSFWRYRCSAGEAYFTEVQSVRGPG